MPNKSLPTPNVTHVAFSPKKLANRWDCSRQHVYNMIKRGEIKAFKMGRHDRIPTSEIERIEGGKT